jgi:hypothetical protein
MDHQLGMVDQRRQLPVVGCLFWLIHHGRRRSSGLLESIGRLVISRSFRNLAQSETESRVSITITDLRTSEAADGSPVRVETRLNLLLEGTCGASVVAARDGGSRSSGG